MQKKNIFEKTFRKLLISITKRIESFFNFFRENYFNKKKDYKNIDNRIILALVIIFISICTYFLLPSFYDQNKIRLQIENQIQDKYNLEVKLNNVLKYGVFPKPHFYSENVQIHHKSNQIAKSKMIKVSIVTKNLFSINNVKVKDLIFTETDFRLNFSNFNFFINLLNKINSKEKVNFINSKLFYLDQNSEIIFLSNVKKLNYQLQENSLKKLSSKLNIFNIPINLEVVKNIDEEIFLTEIKSFPLRLNLKINSQYINDIFRGDLDLTMINKNLKVDYEFKNKILKFISQNQDINGEINIKPFFLTVNLDLLHIDLKRIFEENSFMINIIKSETLNNRNLNGIISIESKNLKGINFFGETKFDILLEEGDIFIQKLITTFKNSVLINLNDTQLIVEDNKLKLSGFLTLDFKDVKKIFEHYQINIKDRKYIKKIKLGFLFHFDDEFVEIYNLKVDGKTTQNLDKFIEVFNLKKNNIFNKIIVRKSVKDFFKIISLD